MNCIKYLIKYYQQLAHDIYVRVQDILCDIYCHCCISFPYVTGKQCSVWLF